MCNLRYFQDCAYPSDLGRDADRSQAHRTAQPSPDRDVLGTGGDKGCVTPLGLWVPPPHAPLRVPSLETGVSAEPVGGTFQPI